MTDTSTNNNPASSYIQSIESNLSSMQDGQVQTITDISELQDIEKDYFQRLNMGLVNDSLTSDEKDTLVQKINEISQMRVNLYRNLNDTYQFYETNVSSTQDTLAEQSAAIDIVENELNRAKSSLRKIEEERNNKLRLIEINNYYGEKFYGQSRIMKVIIFICVPILVLTILFNSSLIPSFLYYILVIIICVVGIITLFHYFYDTYMRDNINYEEYNFSFDKANAPPVDITSWTASSAETDLGSATCSGQACCAPNETYYAYVGSTLVNQCILNDTTTTTSTS